jgi:hypothetical protein
MNGGVDIDFVYPGTFSLANVSDAIILYRDVEEIDRVEWDDGAVFPAPNGSSMSLDPSWSTVIGNDDGRHWGVGSEVFGDGSPGSANPLCRLVIGIGRLQFPADVTVQPGENVSFYGRLYIPGWTDASTLNDPYPQVIAEAGFGTDGSDPSGWTDWFAAIPTPGYDGNDAQPVPEPNNDEYVAVVSAPASPANYDTAFRFSGDGGVTWSYCDINAGPGADGSEDGYSAANSGSLVVTS